MARIVSGENKPVDVVAPVAGELAGRMVADQATVAAGDVVAEISPGEDQVWEALRALYLVGAEEDLADVERFAHGSHALGYDFEIGSRDGIHAGASGKPILAFLPDAEIERILRKPLPRLTKFTVVDPDKLRRQIRQIRKCGYATSRGERMQSDSFGVGAPVFGPHKNVIGSIVVTVPYFRWRKEQLRDVAKIVMHTARQVSALSDVEHPSAGATL